MKIYTNLNSNISIHENQSKSLWYLKTKILHSVVWTLWQTKISNWKADKKGLKPDLQTTNDHKIQCYYFILHNTRQSKRHQSHQITWFIFNGKKSPNIWTEHDMSLLISHIKIWDNWCLFALCFSSQWSSLGQKSQNWKLRMWCLSCYILIWKSKLENIDVSTLRGEHKAATFSRFILPSRGYYFSVHHVHKGHMEEQYIECWEYSSSSCSCSSFRNSPSPPLPAGGDTNASLSHSP